MFRRWDRDHKMSAIEDLVGKSLVLSSEQDRNRTVPRELEQLHAGRHWIGQVAFGRAASRRETSDPHHSIERLLDGIAVSDALDDVARVVGDSLESPGIVFH